MITHIRIQNYRSFVDAEVDLRPFSLVIGANGSGKTNLLRFIQTLSADRAAGATQHKDGAYQIEGDWQPHVNLAHKPMSCIVTMLDGDSVPPANVNNVIGKVLGQRIIPLAGLKLPIFNLMPDMISQVEPAIPSAEVRADGSGTAQVLDALKNGDREDLFDKIEENFRRYVPEVEKLSLRTVQQGAKQIQVREKGLQAPLAASELSEGTRLILCILTIVHQENPPPVILLEDIDRGMHPRIFESVVPLMRDIAERHKFNILATTHNPYLVDCFQDDKEAVIIIEKKDGASTLSTLASKLEGLEYDKVDPEDMPLGNLWYSGLVGGVPLPRARRPARKE